jgi:hypothetical protein
LRRVEYGDERDPKMREFLKPYRTAQQCRENRQTAFRHARWQRPACALERITTDRTNGAAKRNAHLVFNGERGRSRVRQEEEPRLSTLLDRAFYKKVFAKVMAS